MVRLAPKPSTLHYIQHTTVWAQNVVCAYIWEFPKIGDPNIVP